jgi:hypothetical protein
MAGLVVLLVAGLATATLLILHPFGQHAALPAASTLTPTATPAPTPTPALTPTPTPPSPTPTLSSEQGAQNLAALLAQSVHDRSSINNAYSDAKGCGPGLGQDAQIFRNAARSRRQLLSQLAAMPSRSALPGQMLGDLTRAWQVSITVDKDYAHWVHDLVTQGCAGGNQSDPHFVAAVQPNRQATAAKKVFVRQWNPLAMKYGLTIYRQGDL